MNLRTSEIVELSEFMDIEDDQTLNAATDALAETDNWAYCEESTDEYLAEAEGFSPTDEGVILVWPVDGTMTAQCGVDTVLIPWPGTETETESQTAATPEDIDGTWCPTPESASSDGCLNIALPIMTYRDGGLTQEVWHSPEGDSDDGCFNFSQGEQDSEEISAAAPLGFFCPAGIDLDLPDYYEGTDHPDQDRIWNSQTGVLLLRE